MSGLAEGTRVAVVRGTASDVEVTAVLLALDAAARADARAAPPVPAARPGWTAAARLESVGHQPIRSVAELRAQRTR